MNDEDRRGKPLPKIDWRDVEDEIRRQGDDPADVMARAVEALRRPNPNPTRPVVPERRSCIMTVRGRRITVGDAVTAAGMLATAGLVFAGALLRMCGAS